MFLHYKARSTILLLVELKAKGVHLFEGIQRMPWSLVVVSHIVGAVATRLLFSHLYSCPKEGHHYGRVLSLNVFSTQITYHIN